MSEEDLHLVMLAEECAEVIQRVSKQLRFGCEVKAVKRARYERRFGRSRPGARSE